MDYRWEDTFYWVNLDERRSIIKVPCVKMLSWGTYMYLSKFDIDRYEIAREGT